MKKSKTEWNYKEIGRWIMVILGVVLMYKFVKGDSLIYVIRQSLPPREAGLLGGIILGDKSGFDRNFYQYLQNSGLIHLMVVSGSNVMLLVGGVIETLAVFLGRKKTITGGLILGWGYAGLVGWEVPVVRAMLLVTLLYFAQLYGRKYNLGRALIVAIAIMIVGEVGVLVSVSFWLSITAFLGVIMAKNKWLTNIYVSLWITPILAMTFGKISLVSPLANLLVSGLVEVATLMGVAGTMAGMIFLPVGRIILWVVYPILKYLAVVVEMTGSGEWSTIAIEFNWWILIGWYLILGYWFWKRSAKN
jgi:competence protein ComEC